MAAGDIILSDGTTITPEDLQRIAAAVTELINTNAKDPGQWELAESLEGVTSLPVFQVIGSTYKLVRVAVEILKGVDGKEVELMANQDKTYIQWRYTDDMWNNLIAIADLKGDSGETPEFRKGETGVEWKYQSEEEWKTLIPFSELKWNFSDLTPEQIEQLWENLPENILTEFKKPATEAAVVANAAAESANNAAGLATSAANKATEETAKATAATEAANTATSKTKAATERAIQATTNADNATQAAQSATSLANEATDKANIATSNADTATANTNEAITNANTATDKANQATENANAAAQRANKAAQAAEEAVSTIRPDWLAGKESGNYIKNKPEIPTLASAPTEDTLTYINTDGTQVSYKIGDLVRFFDKEDAEDYVFYQLYDIADGKAKWKLGGSGGGGDVREKVRINLSSNQAQPDSSLIGATISIIDTSTLESLYKGTWQGSEIKVNIAPLLSVKVTVGEIEGYTTPAEQTFETAIQGERNLSFVYNTCLVTVNATTNQSEHTDVAGAQITVAYDSVQKTVSSGESVKVPLGKSYTVTASDIQYYQTPVSQELTAETASKDVLLVYNTCVLTISVTGVDFADNEATITYDSVVQTAANGASVKVPYGKNIVVSFPEIDQYSKPIDVEFVASEPNKTVTANYVASGLLLRINSNQSDKSDLASVRANVSWEGSDGVTIGDGDTIGIPTGKVITITFPEVEGYKTPAQITFTNESGISEQTATYETCILTVTITGLISESVEATVTYLEVSKNLQSGDSMKIPYEEQITVSCPEVSSYARPNDKVFTANTTTKNVEMKYVQSALEVTIDSNQSDKSDIAGIKANVSWSGGSGEIGNGEMLALPVGVEVTISFPEIKGYKKPANIVFTHNGGLSSKSGLYKTEVVTVTLSTYDSASVNGQNVTINGQRYPYSAPVSAKIPFGTTYSVSADAKEGYSQPQEQQFTANQVSRSVSLVYKKVSASIITIDQTISDPDTMVGGDVNGEVIQWIRQNSHRVLAKKTGDGKITYCRLKDNDSTKYYDGTTANLTGAEGDVFVKLPTFYYYGTEGDNVELHFAKEKVDDNYIEWDTNILIGAYEAVVRNNKAYSKSGVQSTDDVSQANFKKYAQARGTGYQLVDWQMHCILGCLYYAMYGNTNCQATIGEGTGTYDKVCGQTNALGMTDTKYSTNGNKQSINFWGLENWWGNKFELLDDCEIAAQTLTVTVNDPVNGGKRQLDIPSGGYSGYPKKMKFGRYLDLVATDDDPENGSAGAGYCDFQYWSYETPSYPRVTIRSAGGSEIYDGVAYTSADCDMSSKHPYYGSRLAFRGECTEETDVTTFKKMPIIGKTNGVFIQDIDGKFWTSKEWNQANSRANGVAVLVQTIPNGGFVIAPTQVAFDEGRTWSKDGAQDSVSGVTTTTNPSVAIKDYKGIGNSSAIVSKYGAGTDYAAGWCNNYTFKNGKKGYLGSCGEWREAYNNKAEIDACMSLIGGTAIDTIDYSWTSSQCNSTTAWLLRWADNYVRNYDKGNYYNVRAFSELS